ncbi:hypothetical protein EBB56_11820 [Halomonas sp. YLB-10]|uniref:hypothetical protein n=1 Tax=Halomonas sp. YLB-10 TaxID=2483111 RepID=UPI000F5D84A3|nr:hypothetical protein [Halomonas sp. YLB-10]RQW70853.1 hypothetical protein EBB56_11820 [Halomonas sp. YLB-10]
MTKSSGRFVYLEVTRLFLVFYLVFPLAFYGLPYLYSLSEGAIRLHFFNTFSISSNDFFIFFIGHCLLGSGVLAACWKQGVILRVRRNQSPMFSIITLVLFLLPFLVSNGYIKSIVMPFFLILLVCRWPGNRVFLCLFFIAFAQMLVSADRFPVLLIIMLWLLPFIAKQSFFKIIIFGCFAVLFLVFILQPLRSGILPFSGYFSDYSYFFKHLHPIYIGAHLSLEAEFPMKILLAESIPLMKSLTSSVSVIEVIARMGLPENIIASGIRHGSNSSMYFSFCGIFVLAGLILATRFLNSFVKISLIKNSVIMYFVVYGPYFVRRSFGSYFVDIVVLVFVGLLVTFFVFQARCSSNR